MQLKFDPTTKYGQLSYYDALVKPVAEAVKLANYKGQEVLFAMQAEMVSVMAEDGRGEGVCGSARRGASARIKSCLLR